MSEQVMPDVKYVIAAKDLQEILTYIAKRPLGEVLNVYKAIERAEALPQAEARAVEEAPQN